MIQTVIFDLDGVIIDSEPIHFALEKQMFEELHIPIPVKEHQLFVGMSSQNMWDRIVKKHELRYTVRELVKKKYELYMEYLDNQNNLNPVPGAIPLIQSLFAEKFKLAIASSSHLETIEKVISKFHLSEFFQARISGTELKHSKPDPEIFIKAAECVHSRPAECLVIEDSENGVKAAKAALMMCIGYQNPNSGTQDLHQADIIINTFEEINAEKIRNLR